MNIPQALEIESACYAAMRRHDFTIAAQQAAVVSFLAPKVEAALRAAALEMAGQISVEVHPSAFPGIEEALAACVTAGIEKLGE